MAAEIFPSHLFFFYVLCYQSVVCRLTDAECDDGLGR